MKQQGWVRGDRHGVGRRRAGCGSAITRRRASGRAADTLNVAPAASTSGQPSGVSLPWLYGHASCGGAGLFESALTLNQLSAFYSRLQSTRWL